MFNNVGRKDSVEKNYRWKRNDFGMSREEKENFNTPKCYFLF
jgi:hypothetical protein